MAWTRRNVAANKEEGMETVCKMEYVTLITLILNLNICLEFGKYWLPFSFHVIWFNAEAAAVDIEWQVDSELYEGDWNK